MDLNALRNTRSAAFARMTQEMEKIANPSSGFDDDRFWKLEPDKSGNATATIRFLPGLNPEKDLPWVRLFKHGFQGPTGKWYIENSRTTLGNGEADPVNINK